MQPTTSPTCHLRPNRSAWLLWCLWAWQRRAGQAAAGGSGAARPTRPDPTRRGAARVAGSVGTPGGPPAVSPETTRLSELRYYRREALRAVLSGERHVLMAIGRRGMTLSRL